jgi:membrane-associated protease RseP (regulator of RpoE activity)
MGFLVYDLIFLAFFLIIFSILLYRGRKNLRKEGLLYLYKTNWGIKLIKNIGNKYKRILKALSYVSVGLGYVLMIGVFYLVYTIIKIYVFSPGIARAIKVPPIMPLIPYLPQVFKLEFLPPFYFTYWIVIIAVIAITHEMSHGIFAAHNKVKIKNTGFGFFPFFLPVFLAAFVELDEKVMARRKKFSQLSILSAGTFANALTAILFLIVLLIFFSVAFTPSGVIFDTYAASAIAVAGISSVNNVKLNDTSYNAILGLMKEEGFNEIIAKNISYLSTKEMLEEQKGNQSIFVYNSAPAIRANLSSIITEINGIKIDSIDKLVEELSRYKTGDEITVKTITESGESVEKTLVLEEHPNAPGNAWLGIGFMSKKTTGILGKIITTFSFKKSNTYYEPKFNGLSVFIYNLLWWIIIISVSVALINMLPVGIFDGGRFFYLTIFALTKNEKIAKRAFILITQLFIFILVLLLVFWAISFIR